MRTAARRILGTSKTIRKSKPKGTKKIARVMREFKAGSLKSSSGQKVTNPKQGIAIALSEQRRADKGK